MRAALVAVLTGSLLAVGAPAGWLLVRDPPAAPFGAADAERLATGGAAPADASAPPSRQPAPTDAGATASPQPAPTVATRAADLDRVLPERDPPVEVRLAGITAPVDPVALRADGQLAVPEDVRRAGWWSWGPQAGDPSGAAVLVGHADDREQGLGSFAVLRDLRPDAEVVVRSASGSDLRYRVVSLERFAKTEVPMSRLFSGEGAHRLVLISCGGAFDPVRRSYADNVVVTAVPRA